jgi:hypothetical protein
MQNVVEYAYAVPVRASIAEIEPTDPTLSYQYEPFEIWFRLADNESRILNVPVLTLYGRNDMPESQIVLKSGEWIEIHGEARLAGGGSEELHTDEQRFLSMSNMPSTLKETPVKAGAFYYRSDTYNFDAKTRREQWGCRANEISAWEPTVSLILMPKRTE